MVSWISGASTKHTYRRHMLTAFTFTVTLILREIELLAMYLGMVTHLVLQFCVVIAFSSSSSCPVLFNFFTRLFTAFSHHFSSCPFCSPPPAPPWPLVDFFQPSSLFTTGGVNGKMEDIFAGQAGSLQRTQHKLSHTQREGTWSYSLGPSREQWVTGWKPVLAGVTQKRWTPWEKKVTHNVHHYTQNIDQKINHVQLIQAMKD